MTARVFHADLWGARDDKYGCLRDHDVENTPWTELAPASPMYLFKPQDAGLRAEYEHGWKVTDIFPVNSVGIVTARDHLCIQWCDEAMWDTVRRFVALGPAQARDELDLGRDARDWKVELAQADLRDSGPARTNVRSILYRPFDVRYTYYTGRSRGFLCMPRPEVMHHMLAGENCALITARSNKSLDMDHFFVTRYLMETKCGEATTQSAVFPLYKYPSANGGEPESFAHWPAGRDGRRPNLDAGFVGTLERAMGLTFVPDGAGDLAGTFGPEDVFHYIYALLHAPSYRRRYAEFLRLDFPRIPPPANRERFAALAGLGDEFVALHLLESPAVRNPITTFPVRGDNIVEPGHPNYLAPGTHDPQTGRPLEQGRVYISKDAPRANGRGQYFDGVPPEVWAFQIGGYHVCQKWLKDRRGRALSHDELTRYQQIVVALAETLRLMTRIDEVFPRFDGARSP